ncbi:Early endosome antigen 1 [Chionoecetes opilio]|uniref:Early endosome antigen 1 n=1 Tax=Chionoecetes opilio TaxID=41210 RepID=A0A8J5CQM3_CHIOP|nr:Early endosome antigen 1 [Chionoecetes opilio]
MEDRFRQELQSLRERLIEREIEAGSFQTRETTLHTDLKAKSELAASLKEEIRNLKDEVDLMKKKLQGKDEEVLQVSSRLEDREAALSGTSQQTEELRAKCANYMESIQAMEEQVSELSQKYTTTKSELEALRDQVPSLQTKLNETKDQNNQMTRELSEKAGELESLREKINDASKEESEVLQKKSEQVEELRRNLRETEHDRSTAESALNTKIEAIEHLNTKLNNSGNTLKDVAAKTSSLETALRDREKVVEGLKQQLKEIDTLKAGVAREKSVVKDRDAEILNLKGHVTEVEVKKTEVERAFQDTKEDLGSVKTSHAALKTELVTLKDSLKKKSNNMEEIQTKLKLETNEKETLKGKLSTTLLTAENTKEIGQLEASGKEHEARSGQEVARLKERCEALEKRREEVAALVTSLRAEKEGVEKTRDLTAHEMKTAKGDLQEAKVYCKELEEQVNDFKRDTFTLTQEKARLEEDMKSLQDKSFFNTKVHASPQSPRTAQVSDEVALREALTGQHAAQLAMEQQGRDEAVAQLHTLEETLARIRTEHEQLGKTRKEEVSTLSRQLADQNEKVDEAEGRMAGLEAEVAGLAGDKLELEVRVEAAAEEQQSLVERCLAAESEVERMQGQLTQLRRKLDDSTAALHELGRENQNLQMETMKLAGRKWADDSEVLNCNACVKAFSVTVRRHHCRNCGQIFCHDCSSKQAPLEANKKSVRVCDGCYNELNSKL